MNAACHWSAWSRGIALVLILLVATGCTTTKRLQGPYDANWQVPEDAKTLRLRLADGTRDRNPDRS